MAKLEDKIAKTLKEKLLHIRQLDIVNEDIHKEQVDVSRSSNALYLIGTWFWNTQLKQRELYIRLECRQRTKKSSSADTDWQTANPNVLFQIGHICCTLCSKRQLISLFNRYLPQRPRISKQQSHIWKLSQMALSTLAQWVNFEIVIFGRFGQTIEYVASPLAQSTVLATDFSLLKYEAQETNEERKSRLDKDLEYESQLDSYRTRCLSDPTFDSTDNSSPRCLSDPTFDGTDNSSPSSTKYLQDRIQQLEKKIEIIRYVHTRNREFLESIDVGLLHELRKQESNELHALNSHREHLRQLSDNSRSFPIRSKTHWKDFVAAQCNDVMLNSLWNRSKQYESDELRQNLSNHPIHEIPKQHQLEIENAMLTACLSAPTTKKVKTPFGAALSLLFRKSCISPQYAALHAHLILAEMFGNDHISHVIVSYTTQRICDCVEK